MAPYLLALYFVVKPCPPPKGEPRQFSSVEGGGMAGDRLCEYSLKAIEERALAVALQGLPRLAQVESRSTPLSLCRQEDPSVQGLHKSGEVRSIWSCYTLWITVLVPSMETRDGNACTIKDEPLELNPKTRQNGGSSAEPRGPRIGNWAWTLAFS